MHQQQHSLRGVNTHHNPPLTPKGKLVATCSVSRSPLASSSPLSFSKKKRSSIAVSAALSAAAAAAAVSGTSSSGVGCRASPSKHFSLEKLFSGSGAQHPSHTTTTTSTTTTSSPNLKNSTYPYSSSSPTKKEASKQLALVGSVVVATPTKLSKGKAVNNGLELYAESCLNLMFPSFF